MSAGSGGPALPAQIDTLQEADLRTALAIAKATAAAWEAIANSRQVQIEALSKTLDRYSRRSSN